MTSDQIKYQELMEAKRHNLEAERLGSEDIEQKRRSTAVNESWNREQVRLKELEHDLKERQFKQHQSEWMAEYIQGSINSFLGERDKAWNRFKDAYGMAEFALFS